MAFADLQGRYGLSPATMAGLSAIKGGGTPTIDVAPVEYGPNELAEEEVRRFDPNLPPAERALVDPAGPKVDRFTYAPTGEVIPAPDGDKKPNFDGVVPPDGYVADGSGRLVAEKGYDPNRGGPTPSQQAPQVIQMPAVGGGGRMVGSQWMPGSHSVSAQRGMAPEELQEGAYNRDVAAGHGLLAADERLESAQIRAKADAAYAADRIKAEDQLQTQMAAIQQRRAAYVEDQKKILDQASAEAAKKEDPQAFFKEKGTLGTIWAGLMVGLGQFSAAMTGGQNGALQIINGAIDRNIAAQRANIAGAQKKYDRLNSMYDKNLQMFGDDERAALATRVQYLDKVAAMADSERAKAGPLDASAQNHALVQSIYSERAKAADEFAKLSHTQIAEQSNEHFVPAHVVGNAAAVPPRAEHLVTLPDGSSFAVESKEDKSKATEEIRAITKLQYYDTEILRLKEETDKLNPVTDAKKYWSNMSKLKELGERQSVAVGQADDGSVLRDPEYLRMMKTSVPVTEGLEPWRVVDVSSGTRLSSSNDVLKQRIARSNQQLKNSIAAYSGKGYVKAYGVGPNGLPVPSGYFTGQDATPRQLLPADDAASMSGTEQVPTAGPQERTQIPPSPILVPRR